MQEIQRIYTCLHIYNEKENELNLGVIVEYDMSIHNQYTDEK